MRSYEIDIVCQRDVEVLLLFAFGDGGEAHHGGVGLDFCEFAVVGDRGCFVQRAGVYGFGGGEEV